MTTPSAVLLDVGGVLMLPSHDHLRGALARAGHLIADDFDLDRAHYAGAARLTHERIRDLEWPHYWTSYIEGFLVACGVPDDLFADAHAHIDSEFATEGLWSRIAPGAHAGLRALAATGVRLGIVSNAEGTIEQALRECELVQVGPGPGVEVEVVIDSTVVGVSKPDPRIFQHALDAMQLAATNVWYVGDTPGFDVTGARAAGLRPIVMDPFGHQRDGDCARIATLADLIALFAA